MLTIRIGKGSRSFPKIWKFLPDFWKHGFGLGTKRRRFPNAIYLSWSNLNRSASSSAPWNGNCFWILQRLSR